MSPSAMSAAHSTSTHSDEQLATLRGMLEQQRSFRIDQIGELSRTGALPVDSVDPRADDAVGGEIHNSLLIGARAALRDVIDALARMDEGRYGICRQCNRELPVARLKVLPQLALCMDCQRARES